MNHTSYQTEVLKQTLKTLKKLQKTYRELLVPDFDFTLEVAADVISSNIWEHIYENGEWNYPEDGSVVRLECLLTGTDTAVYMKEYELNGFVYTNAFVRLGGESVVQYSSDALWQYAPECERYVKFSRNLEKEDDRERGIHL